MKREIICGIDEAGRGCLAGHLAVAGVILKSEIEGLNDSKKLSEKRREELYEIIIENSFYEIVLTSSEEIDDIGLSKALHNSILKIKNSLVQASKIIMDGNTSFGVEGVVPIVKADASVVEVSAASILAKVSRDRLILEADREFPQYGFKKHKGYGTKLHRQMIKKFGLTSVHRKSFKIKS
jgi:ribonuclease HII